MRRLVDLVEVSCFVSRDESFSRTVDFPDMNIRKINSSTKVNIRKINSSTKAFIPADKTWRNDKLSSP